MALPEVTSPLERSAIRHSAIRILPLLMVCYFFAYLDRVNLSFAALQMNRALGLSASAYGFGAGLFFITYCLCGVPSNLLLHRYGATRVLGRLMLAMGLCAAAMAFVGSRASFYSVRLLLGAAEAGFYPGVLYFLTLWFPSAYRARMLATFIAAIPVSGIVGAPLSAQLLSLNGVAGLAGWQWLYLVEAVPAIVLAPIVLRRLQDGPAQAAGWLPAAERDWLLGQLSTERRAVTSEHAASIVKSLSSHRVLLLAAVYFTNVCLLNSITFFLPQIVKGFGLSNMQTGWVVAIPSVLALAVLLLWGRRSDRRKERYGHAALANFVGGTALLGSVIVTNPALRIAALSVAFASTLAFTAPFWSIPGTFLTGAAAAGGIAAISALGVTGGFLAPWFTGLMKDAFGDFRAGLGAIALLAMVAAGLLFMIRRSGLPVPVQGGPSQPEGVKQ
jgi:ACS family tartrate transporter-like MFS transporter